MRHILGAALAGLVIGLTAVFLGMHGNPNNMAVCVACFIRDTAGALGLHRAEAVQYIRPEITGIVIGAMIIGLLTKEHASRGGSSPFTRFILGICVMVGALIFLGCPLRMLLRIAGGDLNAVIGFVGFAGGILTGIVFLNKGFSLKRSYEQPIAEGMGLPIVSILLFILLIASPSFVFFSESTKHAPLLLSLTGGLIVGVAAQRSRLCFIAGIRDAVLFKDFHMLIPFSIIMVTVVVSNMVTGKFMIGFENQPIAHTEWVWNILGLYLVGFASALLGGCPFRQLIMAGGGNSDAGVTVLGFFFGAAMCHNFDLVSSSAGTTPNGQVAFVICAAVVFTIAMFIQ